jgi:hypothetical protein
MKLRLIKNELDLGDYKLFLLPGRCAPGFPHVELHNRVYAFWREFWQAVFAENKTPSQPDANVFYRQETVVVIMHGSEIVGTLFCTENNLASAVTNDISYFSRPFIEDFCHDQGARGTVNIATYEMLSVSPRFRKRRTGISFGSVLLGVVVEAFRGFNADVMIGPVRLDNGVSGMVQEFGWQIVSPEYPMHGTPVALSALFRDQIRACPDPAVRSLIERLWREKTDFRTTDAMGATGSRQVA